MRMPYLVQSDSFTVRPWSNPNASKAGSLRVEVARTPRAETPAPPPAFQRERSIFLPEPRLSSSAFYQAVQREKQQLLSRQDTAAIATSSTGASTTQVARSDAQRQEPTGTASVVSRGKRRASSPEIQEISPQQRQHRVSPTRAIADEVAPPSSAASEHRKRAKTAAQDGDSSSSDKVKELEARLADIEKKLQQVTQNAGQASGVPTNTKAPQEPVLTKKERKRLNKEAAVAKQEIKNASAAAGKKASSGKNPSAKNASSREAVDAKQGPKAKTAQSGAAGRPPLTPASASNSTSSNSRPAAVASGSRMPSNTRLDFKELASHATPHAMWGKTPRTKARMFFHAYNSKKYGLAVNMGGDVHLWNKKKSFSVPVTAVTDLDDRLSVQTADWDEDKETMLIGYTEGYASTLGRVPFQVTLLNLPREKILSSVS